MKNPNYRINKDYVVRVENSDFEFPQGSFVYPINPDYLSKHLQDELKALNRWKELYAMCFTYYNRILPLPLSIIELAEY